jgi:phosphohistidine swiveling domain-containing protein
MNELLLPFSDPRALETAVCGGKGASLARGTQAGLPVPEGCVVTVAAYRDWLAEGGPDRVPAALQSALAVWLADWPAAARFAVRSSATAEDGLQHAFAGQHETWLNVPAAQVAARVRDCWLSLGAERAVVYRREAGLSDDEVAMAVVVQRMIPADRAGVGFCLNPITGNLDEFALDAAFGVGETVVSGEYPVDHLVIRRGDAGLVSAALGHKDRCLVAATSGTEETTPAAPDAPALEPAHMQALAGLLNRVEDHYGYPQDVEWAFEGERLYLLQARPITRLPERWTRDESAERFPNPVSHLCWELAEDGFHRSLAHSFELMGLPPYTGKWFARQGQYVYGNQTAVDLFARLALRRLPRFDLAHLAGQLESIRQEFFWVLELPSKWARDLDVYLLQLGELQAVPLDDLDLAGLFRHLQDLRRAGAEYFLPNIAISITQRTLCGLLLHLLKTAAGEETGTRLHTDLLAWCDTKTARVNQDLWELAELLRAEPGLAASLRDQGGEALYAGGLLAADSPAGRRLAKLLADHGHREWDFDPYVAPWLETPGLVLELVRGMLDRTVSPAEEGREARLRMQKAELLVMGHCPDEARYFVGELIRLARLYTSLDDIEHYQTLRLNLPLRRALRAVGARLQTLGVVAEPLDVCFADLDLLARAVADTALLPELAEQIAAEKQAYLAAFQETPKHDLSAADDQPVIDREGVLRGVPGSPGKVRGRVCQVRSTADFSGFVQGAVLVARTTNPAWTPLFFRASAVIAESGGPLSHGAVTARELGLPAVMAVNDALNRLPEGALVEVDGHAGTVTLL